MSHLFGALGAIFGAVGVAMGAFGAHGLRDKVEDRYLRIWETAASYQLWHALALVAVALVLRQVDSTAGRVAGWAFTAGILVFSGSLYTLVLTQKNWLGAITPIGGLSLLIGWGTCAWFAWTELGS